MRFAKLCRPVPLLAATVACILALGACSAGSLGSNDEGGGTTLNFLVDNSEGSTKPAQGLAEAFHAKNPDITVQVQQRPGGADGDNIVKTRLSTGEMTDVFLYNSGSLFQALNPQKNLVPLTGESWANQVEDIFKPTVSVGNELYGAPITSSLVAASSTTRRCTKSWVCRCRRPGPSSWPTTPRSRPPASTR